MTVQIPQELESQLIRAAAQKGVAPEEFVLVGVRQALKEAPSTLFDVLEDVIGSVNADPGVLDFADGLLEKKRSGRL
jgi:hypothetical protein